MFTQQIIKIVGLLLVGGAVIFGYSNYSRAPQTTEEIVQEMSAKITKIQSLEYSGEIKSETNTANFSANFNGMSDLRDLNNPSGSFSFSINTDDLGEKNLTLALEAKIIGKNIYIKLDKIPSFGFLDLSKFANQWIKIDNETLKDQLGSTEVDAKIKDGEDQLSAEQIAKIKKAVEQAKIFKVTEVLADEKIDGVDTRHYKFTIDKEGVKKLAMEINLIVAEKDLGEAEIADLDKNLSALEKSEGEIWIGKRDSLPYKISSNSLIKATNKSETSGKISTTIMLKNFNKPVKIEIPSPVKTFEEIMSGLFGGQTMGLPSNIKLPAR